MVFASRAYDPMAKLLFPVVFERRAPFPKAILVAIFPEPRPTLTLFTVKSKAPKFTACVAPKYGTTLLIFVV